MNNLTLINTNGKFTVDSREVAEMVHARHSDLLEKVGNYITYLTNGEFRLLDFFIPNSYLDAKGERRSSYLLTRKGCDMVANKMTGEKGVLFTATYVTKFEEMEKQQIAVAPGYIDSKFLFQMAAQFEEKERQNLQLTAKIELDKPKVLFANSVCGSTTSILIRDLAKLLKQNGVDIGEKRLFELLRTRGFLITKLGKDYNSPTQKSMDMQLMEVKETSINHAGGSITVQKTPLITGKGQQYFINKFLIQKGA